MGGILKLTGFMKYVKLKIERGGRWNENKNFKSGIRNFLFFVFV